MKTPQIVRAVKEGWGESPVGVTIILIAGTILAFGSTLAVVGSMLRQ